MISIENFVRRVNPDSTIDLICTRCFQTAASGTNEADAVKAAEQHVCVSSKEEETCHL
jgi:hypothetical protein